MRTRSGACGRLWTSNWGRVETFPYVAVGIPKGHPPSVARPRGEVMVAVAAPLPLAWSRADRPSLGEGLVSGLRFQHAPRRVSRASPHASGGMAGRLREGLPPTLQPGRAAYWQGSTGEYLHRSRRRSVGCP